MLARRHGQKKREKKYDRIILSFFEAFVERGAPPLPGNPFENLSGRTLLFSLLENVTGGDYADFFTNGEVLASV